MLSPPIRSTLSDLLALAVATALCGCGGGGEASPTGTTTPGAPPAATRPSAPPRQLFDVPPTRVRVEGTLVPDDVAGALADELVWIRGEEVGTGDWQIDRDKISHEGLLELWAPTRFQPAGPARLVPWAEADRVGAGEVLPDDAGARVPRVDEEFLAGGRGIAATVHEVRQFPPAVPFSYTTTPARVAQTHVGIPPTLEQVARPHRSEFERVCRRTAVAPAPTEIVWTIDVPRNAQLRFGCGLESTLLEAVPDGGLRVLDGSPVQKGEPGTVVFRLGARAVDAPADAPDTELWTREVGLDEVDRFLDARVPLGPWKEQRVEFTFSTHLGAVSPTHHVLPFWSEPVLDAPLVDAPPDVILIVLDTLRADALGCYGNPREVSPNIDALAARGVRFADPMCAATWTLPSHTSIMTSLYPPQHGVQYRERLPEGIVTLAETMRTAGYTTVAVTEGIFVTPRFGLDQGFDQFQISTWSIEGTFDKAISRLRQIRGPLFLYLHTFQAHAPYTGTPATRKRLVDPYRGPLKIPIRNGDWTNVEGGLTEKDLKFMRQVYDAEVATIDEQVGRLLEAVQERGTLDRTMFVVTSDHGEAFLEHGTWGHGTSVYREQLQVPLIVTLPGTYDGGAVATHPVHTIDIAPTIARVAGAEVPAAWMGEPLAAEEVPTSRELLGAFVVPPWQLRATVLRRGSIKVMQFPDNTDLRSELLLEGGPVRAYDVEQDPKEEHDIWPEVQKRLGWDDLSPLWERYPTLLQADRSRVDDALQRRLEELGYAGEH